MDVSVCPGCGLELISEHQGVDKHFRTSLACLDLYWELSAFTLGLSDTTFPHQHVVDAYAAQHVGPGMKPITAAFALIGLYLAFERGYTGRQVQLVHMAIARKRHAWPSFEPPPARAALTVRDVLRSVKAQSYKTPIMDWARSVWDMWQQEHERIGLLIEEAGL